MFNGTLYVEAQCTKGAKPTRAQSLQGLRKFPSLKDSKQTRVAALKYEATRMQRCKWKEGPRTAEDEDKGRNGPTKEDGGTVYNGAQPDKSQHKNVHRT